MKRAAFITILTFFLLSGLRVWAGELSLAGDKQEEAVTVCILDSGCNEPGIQGKNYLDGSGDLSDTENHGTLVYRILEEAAPDADIFMLKCFDSSEEFMSDSDLRSSGEEVLSSTSTADSTDLEKEEKVLQKEAVIKALHDAVDVYKADIIHISWTLNKESDDLHEAIRYAVSQGAIVVAAAGNLSMATPLGTLVYPAAWDEVIGVAGADLDEDGNPVSSLWYLHSEAVFVSADGNYDGQKGSSFAVPRVAAVLAKYLAEEEEPGTEEAGIGEPVQDLSDRTEAAKDYLISIARDVGEPGYDTVFGWGYVSP